MTKYMHKKGNRVVKCAYLSIIADIMKSNATAKFCWMDEGFDKVSDMLHFTSKGHKCILLGVGCPDVNAGTIPLTVLTDWEGEKNVRIDVVLGLELLHINTVKKIACEVYNTLWNPEKDDEWEDVERDTVGYFIDTYM